MLCRGEVIPLWHVASSQLWPCRQPAMTDIATLSICFSSDTCTVLLLISVRDCPWNNCLRETMGARVFICFPTTDLLNWSWCGVFVVNNLHTKPKKKVSIATRKIIDHLEVVHVCGGEPSHMIFSPDYGDNCQILNDIAACKVSYSLFFINCSEINSFNAI